jgi:Ca-activated chloride channel family protein
MTFIWPELLWLLLILPALVLLYLWLMKRKKQIAIR